MSTPKRLFENTFYRYCASSAASFSANLFLTWAFHAALGLPAEAAFAIAIALVFCMNFFMARHFVYRAGAGPVLDQLSMFLIATVGFRFTEYIAFLVLHSLFDVMYLVAAGAVLATSFVIKFFFFGSKVFVVP